MPRFTVFLDESRTNERLKIVIARGGGLSLFDRLQPTAKLPTDRKGILSALDSQFPVHCGLSKRTTTTEQVFIGVL
jgi:hypothetical protein